MMNVTLDKYLGTEKYARLSRSARGMERSRGSKDTRNDGDRSRELEPQLCLMRARSIRVWPLYSYGSIQMQDPVPSSRLQPSTWVLIVFAS